MKKQYSSKDNNLVITDKKNKYTLYGYFTTQDNTLYYIPSEQTYSSEKIRLNGAWQFDNNHDLIYTLSGKKEDKISLRGAIINAEADKILFSVESQLSNTKSKINTLTLNGSWKIDKDNNITFQIKKSKYPYHSLIFNSKWKITQDLQLSYSFTKKNLKQKTKNEQSFTLEGAWQITQKDKLRYIIGKNKNNYIDFRAYLCSNSINAKKNEIKYRIGIGSLKNKKNQILILSGEWRISQDFKIEFYKTYMNDKPHTNVFLGEFNLSDKDTIEVKLKTLDHKITGISVLFTRSFFDDAGVYLEYRKNIEEYFAGGGVRIPF